MKRSSRPEQTRLTRSIQLIRTLTSFHRRPFLIAVSGAAVYALCTVASSFAVSRLIDSVIRPFFVDGAVVGRAYVLACSLMIGVALLRAIGVVVRRSFAGVTQWRTASSLAERVVGNLMGRPLTWHLARQPGDLVARAGVDADAAVALLGPMPFATSVIVMIVTAGIALIVVDSLLGMLALVVLPLMMLLNVSYQRRIDRHFVTAQHELGAFSEAAYESLEGYSVVKAFGAESREAERMASISERLREARIRAVKGRATFDGLMENMPALINVLLIVVGAHRVRSGGMTVGELSGFVYLFTLLVFPLRIIGYVFSELPHSRSGMGRIDEILDEVTPALPVVRPVSDPAHAVELSGIVLSYVDETVLRDVTFTVNRGETVAIVGPTGSGKTTLLMVVAGLLSPDRGTVATGRSSIVFQEPFLFDGSIRENILLGNAEADRLDEALRISCANEFVDDLPSGLDTLTGERGVGLSGGQRQRLALARALCRANDLLLLDDTTSALDSSNEQRVLQSLRDMSPRPAVLMAASRPSAIRAADRIIFMSNGRIQGIGSHEELLARLAEYRDLVTSYETGRAHG